MRTAIDVEANSVHRTANTYPATSASTPTTTLKALTSARKAVVGSALIDARTGKLPAAGGKSVPLAGVDVAGRAAEVLDANGTAPATTTRGTAVPAAADSGLPATAARAAKAGPDTDGSGSLLGAATGSRRTVAGWAQVASATGPGSTDDL